MFKYVLVFLSVNFAFLGAQEEKAHYKALVKNWIASSKKLKTDASVVEEKSKKFQEGTCGANVFGHIFPKVQEVLQERKNLKHLLVNYKKQDEQDINKWIQLAQRVEKNTAKMAAFQPDWVYLQTHDHEEN
jgi:hypothetical protein